MVRCGYVWCGRAGRVVVSSTPPLPCAPPLAADELQALRASLAGAPSRYRKSLAEVQTEARQLRNRKSELQRRLDAVRQGASKRDAEDVRVARGECGCVASLLTFADPPVAGGVDAASAAAVG